MTRLLTAAVVAVAVALAGLGGSATAAERPVDAPIDAGALPLGAKAADAPIPLFELFPVRWKSSKIKYYNNARAYADDVKRAAAAWNGSGAKVKLKAVAKKRAAVVIKPSLPKGSPYSGLATTNGKRGVIQLYPDLYGLAENSDLDTEEGMHLFAQTVIVHEMGHIIGLDHEDDVCAAMNSVPLGSCDFAPLPGQFRCRALQPDDVRGAIRLFGGKVRDLGPEYCGDAEPAPSAVENLEGFYNSQADVVVVQWTLPAVNPPDTATAFANRTLGTCPSVEQLDDTGYPLPGGEMSGVDEDPRPGVNCYTVVGRSPSGRFGAPATVTVTVP